MNGLQCAKSSPGANCKVKLNMANGVNDVVGLPLNSEEPGIKLIVPDPVSDPAIL